MTNPKPLCYTIIEFRNLHKYYIDKLILILTLLDFFIEFNY